MPRSTITILFLLSFLLIGVVIVFLFARINIYTDWLHLYTVKQHGYFMVSW